LNKIKLKFVKMTITGEYRGSAHQSCNLELKFPNCIPVIFYDLSNYDHIFSLKFYLKKLKKLYYSEK
jgi:hypothetical protein